LRSFPRLTARSKATVKVRIAIDQRDPRILPDMGVRVSFLEDAPQTAATGGGPARGVLVPQSSIVDRGGHSVVFVVDADRARARQVSPGQAYGDLRLIDGIANGTRVVREPPADLTDGARIAIK
jgi:hypothetical protein